jgi:hypothetical protein
LDSTAFSVKGKNAGGVDGIEVCNHHPIKTNSPEQHLMGICLKDNKDNFLY